MSSQGQGDAAGRLSQSFRNCAFCDRSVCCDLLRRCSSCDSAVYCSQECKQSGWSIHQPLCTAVKLLRCQGSLNNANCYSRPLNLKQRGDVVKLIGKKCTVFVQCNFSTGSKLVEVLLDTGAQCYLISESLLSRDFFWLACQLLV